MSEEMALYLHQHIPLSRAMDVSVVSASAAEVVLEAPLDPNINVHGTMFGGSVATLGLLAAWSVIHLRLEAEGIGGQIVVHKTSVEYFLPVSGTVRAMCTLDEAGWNSFRHIIERRGKARLIVVADLWFGGEMVARLTGEFVAIVDRNRATIGL